MCKQCKGFSGRQRLNAPREYLDIVRQLQELVAAGTFAFLDVTCTSQELLQSKQWPSDSIRQTFACTACGQRFLLSAESYHGSGAEWEMVISHGSSSIQ
jgi:hypothetical protein